MEWPDDADGNVFRSMQADGFDFEQECTIDFNIDFDNWPIGDDVAQLIQSHFPNAQIIQPDAEDLAEGRDIGYVRFQMVEKLTYELVMDVQNRTT